MSTAVFRVLLLLFAALLAACSPQETVENSPTLPLSPRQSPNDSKAYRYIALENGLQALLISDAKSTKAAASLDVFVGSASNPEGRDGLAHFLEHMLFLGTEKYPDSGEYARFIAEHGGSRNAYTAFEHTNYFFDIDSDHLPEALDRFAQFFIAPRFDTEYVNREVNAVHAEYQQGLNTDARRNLDVLREIANPEHPYHLLAVGTRDTLADRPDDPVRDDLLTFYEQFYSANLMRLAVVGNEDLDTLETLVTDIFSAVPNRNVAIDDISAPLIVEERLPLQVNIQPLATSRTLSLSFALPNLNKYYRTKPLNYISNLIGHEGEGSLLSLLKAEGWAEALGSGSGISYRGGASFDISINLTERGVQESDAVVAAVFEYIRMLEAEGPSRRLYDEQSQLAALAFRFQESVAPSRYATMLSNAMQQFEPEDVLAGNYLMTQYQPDLIQDIVENYLVPERVLLTLTAPGVPVTDQSEYYQTPYSVESIDLAQNGWQEVASDGFDPRLFLPEPNTFIAEDVELRPLPEDNPEVPSHLVAEARLNIWQRQDPQFRVPKGALYSNFRTGLVSGTVEHAAASELYVSLLRDAVNEFTYPALLAGLNYSLSVSNRGVSLSMGGYNDKQPELLARVVDNIDQAKFDETRFINVRDDLIRSLENVKTARAYQQVLRQGRRLLTDGRYSEAELVEALKSLTPEDVAAHGKALWQSSAADILLYGNYDSREVADIRDALAPLLQQADDAAAPAPRITRLTTGEQFVYAAEVEHNDAVLIWYIQAPEDNLENRAQSALTAQVIGADYFEDLRTDQQLGYVVNAFNWPLLDIPGFAMMVQSPKAPAPYLLSASETFLKGRLSQDDAVTEAQFLRHKAALLEQILEPPKNLFDASGYYWREINRGSNAFDSKIRLAEAVRFVTFDEWKTWYQNYVLEQPASLVMISAGRFGEVPDQGTIVGNPDVFKAQQPFYDRRLRRDQPAT
ncbi:MAG: insulinase family protein [Pseudomonadota bacterium]